jgi:hypothetical protein
MVLLQCGEHEAQVTASEAVTCARALADEFREPVYLRDPVTDEIIGTVRTTTSNPI